MLGLLGTEASFASDLNLLLQIIILILLFVGVKFVKEKTQSSLKTHGRIMTIAVVLNAIGFILVMGPSFVGYFSTPLQQLLKLPVVVLRAARAKKQLIIIAIVRRVLFLTKFLLSMIVLV